MSRKKSNRKEYLKRKLINAGYDVQGLDLFQLEELDKEFKRDRIIKKQMGRIEKKDQPTGSIEGEKEYTADRDFYKVVKGELKEVNTGNKYIKLLDRVKRGYIPSPLEVYQYNPEQQTEILKLISWSPTYRGQSPLIKGRGLHKFVDFEGGEIKPEKKDKKEIWKF